MIRITAIKYLEDYKIKVFFDDGISKVLDFEKLIEFKGVALPLKDKNYFKSVKIIRNGRGFAWENEYDCCADWARKID